MTNIYNFHKKNSYFFGNETQILSLTDKYVALNEEFLIESCRKYNQSAQQELYQRYAGMLLLVVRRYALLDNDAQDILHEGFIKIIRNFGKFKYRGKGSLEAWMKQIVANTAISKIKKEKKYWQSSELNEEQIAEMPEELEQDESGMYQKVINAEFSQEQLLSILDEIPYNFRLIFNLHVIEGFKHREIEKMTGIKENTSRTRLLRARTMLQKKLIELTSVKETNNG